MPGLAEVWDALPEARMVGGAVRDTLSDRPLVDVDLAVPLPPTAVMDRFAARGMKMVPTGLAHGTVTVLAGGRGYEVTSLRRDVATDGRHAQVAFTDDWEVDASRRDFTINAMSMARGGEVFDYFGGRDDLAAGEVRFVGDAKQRIAEDYLRIFRFFRFFAWYGKRAPNAPAVAAIRSACEGIRTLSAERVWAEVKRMLMADDPRKAVDLMRETGVLAEVMPDADTGRFDALVARGAPADALLRAAALLGGDVTAWADRWKLSGAERATLGALTKPFGFSPGADDATLRRALADEPAEVLIRRSWLEPGWDSLRERLIDMKRPVFPIKGRDVTALGVAPGPRVGEILAAVEAWWKAGGCVADAEACRKQARLF